MTDPLPHPAALRKFLLNIYVFSVLPIIFFCSSFLSPSMVDEADLTNSVLHWQKSLHPAEHPALRIQKPMIPTVTCLLKGRICEQVLAKWVSLLPLQKIKLNDDNLLLLSDTPLPQGQRSTAVQPKCSRPYDSSYPVIYSSMMEILFSATFFFFLIQDIAHIHSGTHAHPLAKNVLVASNSAKASKGHKFQN